MVTYGFYNSINHDRVYDATQMSEIFDGIIRDGVYQYVGNKFSVDKNGLEGFQVRVGTGRAWFNHTWTKNDAPLILTLPAPPTLDNYYRADAIVIDINANVNVRKNKITYVTGTEVADNPSPPYPELLDGEHKQIALAYIVRKGAETEINAANINYVVGSNPCPYVTAPVQAVDLSAHVAQWQAAWTQWFNTNTTGWESELEAAEAAVTAATNGVVQYANNSKETIGEYVSEFRVWIASQQSQFDDWMVSSKNDFDSWFANIRYILDGDVAGHLQNEIDALTDRVVPIKNGGTGNSNGHIQSGFSEYTNARAEISINNPGLFATSEGMNTTAGGESSHAEGGGNYTYRYQDAHIEGDRLWDGDDYLIPANFQPTRLSNLINVCGKAGGTEVLSLTLSGNDYGSTTVTGTFSNITVKGWAIYYSKNSQLYYLTSGEIDGNDISFSKIIEDSIKISFTGTLPSGSYSYTYGVYGTETYILKFYDDNYVNDVNAGIIADNEHNQRIDGLPNMNINDDDFEGDIRSLYFCAILKNETTGKILKHEVGCIGYANLSESNYVGHFGNIDYHYKERSRGFDNLADFGMLSSVYGEDFTPGQYDPDYDDGDFVRIELYTDETHHTYDYTSLKYWYIDGETPEDSTILIKQMPCFVITKYDPDIAHPNGYSRVSVEFISNDYQAYRQNKAVCRYPIMTIKAGNTNKYSLYLYYSPTSSEDDMIYPIEWVPAGESLVKSGKGTLAVGKFSHAEGYCTFAAGDYSHAEGDGYSTKSNPNDGPGAFGDCSHVEGKGTKAFGDNGSHAEGYETIGYGEASHAEGYATDSHGYASHAEGNSTIASGGYSHAEGYNTEAKGNGSHAGGQYITAYDNGQFVHGYTADPRDNSLTNDHRLIYPTIFGIGGKPRWFYSNQAETTPTTLDELNEIVNKNRNGFTAVLKCGTTINSIYYKTLMPNDTFGTFLEIIQVIAGDPVKEIISSSGRLVQLSPNGSSSNCSLTALTTLFDNHPETNNSPTGAMTLPVTVIDITIDGTTYKHPMIHIKNPHSNMISNSTRSVYIKYSLIRVV